MLQIGKCSLEPLAVKQRGVLSNSTPPDVLMLTQVTFLKTDRQNSSSSLLEPQKSLNNIHIMYAAVLPKPCRQSQICQRWVPLWILIMQHLKIDVYNLNICALDIGIWCKSVFNNYCTFGGNMYFDTNDQITLTHAHNGVGTKSSLDNLGTADCATGAHRTTSIVNMSTEEKWKNHSRLCPTLL